MHIQTVCRVVPRPTGSKLMIFQPGRVPCRYKSLRVCTKLSKGLQLLQNHDFRSSAAPWSPADGSVGSRGPAGTFLRRVATKNMIFSSGRCPVGANPYLCVLAPTVRRLSILLENHEFRSSGSPWSPTDGSVGSRGSAGTFLDHTNRLPRRSAPRSLRKHDFLHRVGALSVQILTYVY